MSDLKSGFITDFDLLFQFPMRNLEKPGMPTSMSVAFLWWSAFHFSWKLNKHDHRQTDRMNVECKVRHHKKRDHILMEKLKSSNQYNDDEDGEQNEGESLQESSSEITPWVSAKKHHQAKVSYPYSRLHKKKKLPLLEWWSFCSNEEETCLFAKRWKSPPLDLCHLEQSRQHCNYFDALSVTCSSRIRNIFCMFLTQTETQHPLDSVRAQVASRALAFAILLRCCCHC